MAVVVFGKKWNSKNAQINFVSNVTGKDMMLMIAKLKLIVEMIKVKKQILGIQLG